MEQSTTSEGTYKQNICGRKFLHDDINRDNRLNTIKSQLEPKCFWKSCVLGLHYVFIGPLLLYHSFCHNMKSAGIYF